MKILAVGAHPDDIEFQCAGTLSKYRRLGHDVAICVATNGNVGSSTCTREEIAAIRRREAGASAEIIGAEFHWLDYPDEFLFNTQETRLRFIDMVRQVRPDMILCPHPQKDYHPDHTTVGQIIWDIHVMVNVPNIETPTKPCEVIPEIVYMDTFAGVNLIPNRYVDITDDMETKTKMLSCHASQESWLMDLYGVTGVEMMKIFAKTRGFQCGCTYAEAFVAPAIWPRKVDKDALL